MRIEPSPLVVNDWETGVIEPMERLISRWTRHGNDLALGLLLPGWRSNVGLKDGWHATPDAVHAMAASDVVGSEVRGSLLDVAHRTKYALDNNLLWKALRVPEHS